MEAVTDTGVGVKGLAGHSSDADTVPGKRTRYEMEAASHNMLKDEKLEFLAQPDQLHLKLKISVEHAIFEKFCRPALKALIADGIDICSFLELISTAFEAMLLAHTLHYRNLLDEIWKSVFLLPLAKKSGSSSPLSTLSSFHAEDCKGLESYSCCRLQGPSASRSEANIHVVLNAPHNESFTSLAPIARESSSDDTFTEVPMPAAAVGKVWHALEVLAVVADETFVKTIRGYRFQHICDAAVIAHFLHNDIAFKRLTPSTPSLNDLIANSTAGPSDTEYHNFQILMNLPDDIVASWAGTLNFHKVLALPQSVVNVWCSKAFPLRLDLKSVMLPFPQLVSLCSALRCTPKLEFLSLKLRTFRRSHGKGYRESSCSPAELIVGGKFQGCPACTRWSIFNAAATLDNLKTLDLSGNSWTMISAVFVPLLKSKSLQKILLHDSVVLDAVPEELQGKVAGQS